MKLIPFLFSIILLFSCKDQESRSSSSCTNTQRSDSTTLSIQLEPFKELMQSKTGVYILEEGEEAMISRAWLCEHAEKSIDVQYFIFSTDNVGLIGIDFLLRAAERGVKVRILVDDFMVDVDGEDLLILNSHENIDIKIYNPNINIGKSIPEKIYNVLTDFQGINQRMHNKTFTVDNKVVITGGRNVADEYFDYDHEYNFRDRDALLIGKIVSDISNSFNLFWEDSLSQNVSQIVDQNIEFEIIKNKFNEIHEYACDTLNFWPQVRKKMSNVVDAFKSIQNNGNLVWIDNIEYISDLPGKNDGSKGMDGSSITTDSLISLFSRAQHSVDIQSPYLVTTDEIRDLFSNAINDSVKIRILTNSLASTDNLDAFNGYQRDRKKLLETGVEIYEYKPDAAIRLEIMTGALQKEMDFSPIFGLHAKSMVIDDSISVVGTFNLDPRSAHLNTECLVVIHSKEIAKQIKNEMDKEFEPENSWRTTLEFNPDSVAGRWKNLKAASKIIVPKKIL